MVRREGGMLLNQIQPVETRVKEKNKSFDLGANDCGAHSNHAVPVLRREALPTWLVGGVADVENLIPRALNQG
jgi:hypothetical protein